MADVSCFVTFLELAIPPAPFHTFEDKVAAILCSRQDI
jgi:hypothetical protein